MNEMLTDAVSQTLTYIVEFIRNEIISTLTCSHYHASIVFEIGLQMLFYLSKVGVRKVEII